MASEIALSVEWLIRLVWSCLLALIATIIGCLYPLRRGRAVIKGNLILSGDVCILNCSPVHLGVASGLFRLVIFPLSVWADSIANLTRLTHPIRHHLLVLLLLLTYHFLKGPCRHFCVIMPRRLNILSIDVVVFLMHRLGIRFFLYVA